jgi:hypothetical protein
MGARTSAQVAIVPQPHQDGFFTLDDIWRISLISPGAQSQQVRVEATIEDAQHQMILTAQSPVFVLRQGANRPSFSATTAGVQYGNQVAGSTLRSTGRLPYGNYIICYRVINATTNALLGEFCQEETIKPFSPPELISPFDRETVSTTYPLLTWKPPFPPGSVPVEYALVLVELKKGQSNLEALEKNAPMLSRRGLFTTTMPYPADAPKLEEGKSYAWQVSAKAGAFELGVTEIWSFKVEKAALLVPINSYIGYRELNLAPTGSFNVAKRKVKFYYNNRFGSPQLNYGTPASLENASYKVFACGNLKYNMPPPTTSTVTLDSGVNKISIDLSTVTNPAMVNGNNYILVFRDATGKEYYLEFTYLN